MDNEKEKKRGKCVSTSVLIRLVTRQIPKADSDAIKNHIANCEKCMESFEAVRLAKILSSSPPPKNSEVFRCPSDTLVRALVNEGCRDRNINRMVVGHLQVCRKCMSKALQMSAKAYDTSSAAEKVSEGDIRFANKVASAAELLRRTPVHLVEIRPSKRKPRVQQCLGKSIDKYDRRGKR